MIGWMRPNFTRKCGWCDSAATICLYDGQVFTNFYCDEHAPADAKAAAERNSGPAEQVRKPYQPPAAAAYVTIREPSSEFVLRAHMHCGTCWGHLHQLVLPAIPRKGERFATNLVDVRVEDVSYRHGSKEILLTCSLLHMPADGDPCQRLEAAGWEMVKLSSYGSAPLTYAQDPPARRRWFARRRP